jgi:hypothetical protein
VRTASVFYTLQKHFQIKYRGWSEDTTTCGGISLLNNTVFLKMDMQR